MALCCNIPKAEERSPSSFKMWNPHPPDLCDGDAERAPQPPSGATLPFFLPFLVVLFAPSPCWPWTVHTHCRDPSLQRG